MPPGPPHQRPGRDPEQLHDLVAVEVGAHARQVLLGGDQDLRLLGDEVEQLAEGLDREDVGDVGPFVLEGRELRGLAVLGRQRMSG